jgi:import inner membrane translocase subunit TIM8
VYATLLLPLLVWLRQGQNGGLSGAARYATGEREGAPLCCATAPLSDPCHLCPFQAEQHKAVFNELVSLITNKCFEKCVGSPGKSLSSSEQACVSQCTLRFLETNQVILQRLQQQK